MIRNEIFSWAIKLWIICVIGFTLFCLGRGFNHFPKHEVSVVVPISPVQSITIPVYEAVKTAGNSYEILRRVR